MIAESAFDSRHYGLRVGRLVLEEAEQISAARDAGKAGGFDVLFARVRDDADAVLVGLERAGHRPLETLVTSVWNGRPPGAPQVEVEHHDRLHGADLEAVCAITSVITGTHFHNDPRLPLDRTRALYAEWARNDATGRSPRTLVARQDGRVIGYLTVLEQDRFAVVDLIAVAAEAQGKGVGQSLLASFLAWAQSVGRAARIGTQATNPALRLYQRMGFEPTERLCTFHLWLDR